MSCRKKTFKFLHNINNMIASKSIEDFIRDESADVGLYYLRNPKNRSFFYGLIPTSAAVAVIEKDSETNIGGRAAMALAYVSDYELQEKLVGVIVKVNNAIWAEYALQHTPGALQPLLIDVIVSSNDRALAKKVLRSGKVRNSILLDKLRSVMV